MKENKVRIITFDIETSPCIITKFQFDKNPFIDPASIQKDWFMISACWKELGNEKVNSVAITEVGNDYNVVKTLRDALANADIIVGHCIDRFDLRNLNTRLLYHNLPPLPKIPTIDTKKQAKSIGGFTSNKLDYLGKFLLGHGKIKTDYDLWLRVLKGEKKAIKEMVEYNKVDVIRNEELYLRLRPFMRNHPHIGVMENGVKADCPKCGAAEVQNRGFTFTASGNKNQKRQCTKCNGWHTVPVKQIK